MYTTHALGMLKSISEEEDVVNVVLIKLPCPATAQLLVNILGQAQV